MAHYQYDEGGGMAAYFMLSFLTLILVPLSYSLVPSKKHADIDGCPCSLCIEQRDRIKKKERSSVLRPKLGPLSIFVICGWALFAYLVYKVTNNKNVNKMYDPYEILGIKLGTDEKAIKSHYKKLSLKFHPDKVRLAVNQTIEEVESYFVEITKAYKSLTDPVVRENWELYGHPDGRQEISMGIAIPKWVVEGKNKFWILFGYCAVIGGLLPVIVGKWWFGSRIKTKDGVLTKTATVVFKNLKESHGINEVLECLGQAVDVEFSDVPPVSQLEEAVRSRLGGKYKGGAAQTLLNAHLLRIPVKDPKRREVQEEILLRIPALATSLLNVAMSRNWLLPTISILRLQAFLAQGVHPALSPAAALLTQLPHISEEDVKASADRVNEHDLKAFVEYLQENKDGRADEVAKSASKWGRLDLVEASFRVIGERIVTPSAIVQLFVKARVTPPVGNGSVPTLEDDKRALKLNDEKDADFLAGKKDTEELTNSLKPIGWAHTPFWPTNRKPSWWVVIADHKSNKVVMPPMKISDVPISNPSEERNYRAYKLQFQAPQQVATFSWKIHVISDTFINEEVVQDLVLKVDDPSLLNDEEVVDDDISEPEEDSLAGQMALMRGGAVKKSPVHDDDSEDESGTDVENSDSDSLSDSSSDSD